VVLAAREHRLDGFLRGLLPQLPEYTALVEAARHYRSICDSGGWEPVEVPRRTRGRHWKDGDGIRRLKARLAMEKFFTGTVDHVFDEALTSALKAYHSARHFKARGVFHKGTARALNVPCAERLDVLTVNVRRWRHSARTDENTYIFANLPAMEVHYVRAAAMKATHKTVVGSGDWFWSSSRQRRIYPRASPIMKDSITGVVVNPTWTVPRSIIKNELEPRQEKDPTYAETRGYVINEVEGRRIWIQQAGAMNALGRVKLSFPNSEAIYMHDTPSKGGFRREVRDLSHGCVRVHKALDFANQLLMDDRQSVGESFPKRRVHVKAKKDKTFYYTVREGIPVFLEYYTASVTPDGLARFHPDIYDYDRMLGEGGVLPRRRDRAHPRHRR